MGRIDLAPGSPGEVLEMYYLRLGSTESTGSTNSLGGSSWVGATVLIGAAAASAQRDVATFQMSCRHLRFAIVVVLGFTLLGGFADIHAQPTATLSLEDITALTGEPFAVSLSVGSTDEGVRGFSTGICHDPAWVEPVNFVLGSFMEQLNGGTGPELISVTLNALGPGSGLTCGTIFGAQPAALLPAGITAVMVEWRYDVVSATPGVTPLVLCDNLGSPVVDTQVVLESTAQVLNPVIENSTVTLIAGNEYIRGDANLDGDLLLGDAIAILNYLFLMGANNCFSAFDVNAGGDIGITDPLYLLTYLLLSGPPPPAPFPECGVSAGGIGCVGVAVCP